MNLDKEKKEEKSTQQATPLVDHDQNIPAQFKDNRHLKKKQKTLQKVANSKTAQLNLNVKGSKHGDKVDGSMASVGEEVGDVIARNKPGEMLSDISKLEKSIQSRKAEQATFKDKTDPAYISHQKRIEDEENELGKLQIARAQELASRPKKAEKPKKDKDGFTLVTKKKRK